MTTDGGVHEVVLDPRGALLYKELEITGGRDIDGNAEVVVVVLDDMLREVEPYQLASLFRPMRRM